MEKEGPRVLVLHGPNLNMLGIRETHLYGEMTLTQIDDRLRQLGTRLKLYVETFQSNYEGALVEKIQSERERCQGIIINPAAFTHTSVAIRDALILVDAPIIEVHLSNIHKREPFRHKSMVSDVAVGQIVGFGHDGYAMALEAMARMIGSSASM